MINKFFEQHEESLVTILSSLISIFFGLILGYIIILVVNPDQSIQAFKTILMGGFVQGSKSLGDVFFYATPVILAGLSVGIAFKSSMINIGASGQFTIGAIVAILLGVHLESLPSVVHISICVIAGTLAGALWALVPGLLKAYRNVNEVVTTIMMNYVAMYVTKILIVNFAYDQAGNQTLPVKETAVIPTLGLDKIFQGSLINAGIIFAIILAIVLYVVMYKTPLGYGLRTVGSNRNAAKYAGIDAKKHIITSMLISGGVAGLAGSIVYLNDIGKTLENLNVITTIGFDGIPVALLANNNPLGIIFSGLFLGYLKVGGFYMQLYDLSPEIINIIVASIIYFSSLSLIFRNVIYKAIKKPRKKEVKNG